MPKIFLAQIAPRPNQLFFNTMQIMMQMDQAKLNKADIVIFGETALQGYNVKNSLVSELFFKTTETCIEILRKYAETLKIGLILGLYKKNQSTYGKPAKNCIWSHFPEGISGVIPEDSIQEKQLIPRQAELDEILYVAAGNKDTMQAHHIGTKNVVYHVCQDSWRTTPSEIYEENPLQQALDLNADVIINFSASPWYLGKWYAILTYLKNLATKHRLIIIYLPISGFEDQQFLFTSGGFVIDQDGQLKVLLPRFSTGGALINLETLSELPIIHLETTITKINSNNSIIKLNSLKEAMAATINAICIQYGITNDSLFERMEKASYKYFKFLPKINEILNQLTSFKKEHSKKGFAFEFANETNVFLLIYLLRNNAPSDIPIVLGLPENLQLTLTPQQTKFLSENNVDIVCSSYSFRAYARRNRLLLMDTFNLTEYRIGPLNTNIYGLSLFGSLTLSVIYKLIFLFQLQNCINTPSEDALLQQKLVDHIIKKMQFLPNFDMSELSQTCLPYFIKKLKNQPNKTTELIQKYCEDTVRRVLKLAEDETWHGARIKPSSISQFTIYAPARSCKPNPPSFCETPKARL